MSEQNLQPVLFDYSAIDTETTSYLKQNAQETRGLLTRSSEDILKIGRNLLDAKERLPHGEFIPWVKAELGISQSTSWRFMQAAQGKEVKKKSFTVNDLMEQLSAPTEDHSLEPWLEGLSEESIAKIRLMERRIDLRGAEYSIWMGKELLDAQKGLVYTTFLAWCYETQRLEAEDISRFIGYSIVYGTVPLEMIPREVAREMARTMFAYWEKNWDFLFAALEETKVTS